jgi:hypothetical protein
MRAWIRKHRIGALLLGVLSVAVVGCILVFFYFNFCFTLKWANAADTVQPSRQAVIAMAFDSVDAGGST